MGNANALFVTLLGKVYQISFGINSVGVALFDLSLLKGL